MTTLQKSKLIIQDLEKEIQEWIDGSIDKKYQIHLLEQELQEYRKLKSAVHKDIEKVWMYDSSYGLDDNQTIDRDACIEAVFYKVANQWID